MSTRPSAHPSAEEFLRQLILFINSHGDELLSSSSAFKLQPRALECLASRLEGLRQLQRVKTSNPIRFLAGAVADLSDFLRMEKVQNFCSLVKYLKLYSAAQDVRDPTPINFSPFKSLMTVEIRGCNLSSVCPSGVETIRPTVECIICQDSIERLWHLLEPTQVTEEDGSDAHRRWPKLKHFSCIYNNLKEIDASLSLADNVTSLDFSRNDILQAEHLRHLTHLVALDLSFNRLASLGEIPLCTGVRRLFLQSNGIRCLEGIQNLERLEEADLRWNVLSSLREIVKLKSLSSLRLVSLAGNPICASASYRPHVLACLLEWRDDVNLDGKQPTEVEIKKARRTVVSRDGIVEANLAESTISTVPSPSSLWECVSPLFRHFWRPRHLTSSNSEASHPLIPDSEDIEEPRPPPRPVKRIVDLPDTTFHASMDLKGGATDTRNIPRIPVTRRQSQSMNIGSFNGDYESSRYGAVGLA